MPRFFVAALLGGLAGLILDAVLVLMSASYPDLPRPSSFRSGAGALVELQDQLMDRELALFVCKRLTENGFDFYLGGLCAAILSLSLYNRIGDCWIRQRFFRRLREVLLSKYVVAAIFSFSIFSFVIWSMNVRCFVLCAACVLHPYTLLSFVMSGILPVILCTLLRTIWRRTLSSTTFFSFVMLIVFASSLLCGFWPDLVNPVAESTARIMEYGKDCWGVTTCGTKSDLVWYKYFFHDLVLIFFMAYIGFETSRCVLAKQVFEPLVTSFVNRPTFYELAKVSIVLFIILGFNLVIADTFAQELITFPHRS
ncbi:MAG: hypothetical protein HYX67_05445 [Candidatus Melainabacteria bacterium]|nr:hypothetical protein [Candidatus Melainabacteria bacterium]